MVRLYNDPEGETVFTAHEEAYQVHNSLPHISQTWHEELASLKRKVEELKDTVVEYKVTNCYKWREFIVDDGDI